jgi:hypothetical protein
VGLLRPHNLLTVEKSIATSTPGLFLFILCPTSSTFLLHLSSSRSPLHSLPTTSHPLLPYLRSGRASHQLAPKTLRHGGARCFTLVADLIPIDRLTSRPPSPRPYFPVFHQIDFHHPNEFGVHCCVHHHVPPLLLPPISSQLLIGSAELYQRMSYRHESRSSLIRGDSDPYQQYAGGYHSREGLTPPLIGARPRGRTMYK